MHNKIIAAALCILLSACVMAACGKKDKAAEAQPTASVEYTTDTDGNLFVTNINGDLIPVTTGKDGSVDMISDLVTKTKEQADKEKEDINDQNPDPNPNPNPNPNPDPNPNPNPNDGEIVIGTDPNNDGKHDAIINWN